ncbi:hypothetical protein LCGC14_0686700 [marine sediment metagenome]|uniref:Uncharacterized protein n=1 Tax=marine sediment metagenome TaxID=412755 RepID=A0A0F9TUN6_9ZZZZ
MAKVVKVGKKYGVAHAITGKILVRKGRRAIFSTRAEATADAEKTRCRVLGICPRKKGK